MLKNGDVLVHPVHGDMVVCCIGSEREEQIDGVFVQGYEVHAVFDRLIKGVAWRKRVNGEMVSMLIFHSGYLDRLEIKE